MKKTLHVFIFISMIFFNINIMAANQSVTPSVKLCIDKKCKTPYQIKITHDNWTDIKEMFSAPFNTDKDEQDNIASAISLIEYDIYHGLARMPSQTLSANDLYVENSIKNHYRNIKNILGILLDRYLIKHHLMRKTITWKNWAGIEKTALLLQSLTNSQLYILESYGTELGQSPEITRYKKSSSIFESDADSTSNSLNDDDFE